MVIDAILTTLIIIIYAALGVPLGFRYKHINWHIGRWPLWAVWKNLQTLVKNLKSIHS